MTKKDNPSSNIRQIIIQIIDGQEIKIIKAETSGLELCEICRRIIHQNGG